MSKRSALTLSEFLVIIVVIGLFIAIILPSLGILRINSGRVYCSTNLKDQWAGMKSFADANAGRLPMFPTAKTGGSLHDQPIQFTNALVGAAPTLLEEKQFYCPNLALVPMAMDIGWNGTGGFRALGYTYLNDRIAGVVPPITAKLGGMNPDVPLPARIASPDISYHRTLTGDQSAELVFDLIVTGNPAPAKAPANFNAVLPSAVPVYPGETTANLTSTGTPEGQNVLHVGGSVDWRYFRDTAGTYTVIGPGGTPGNPVFWWLQNP